MLFSSLVLFAALALAAPTRYVRHEQHRLPAHTGWVKRGRAPGNAQVPVRIALAQQNLHHGYDMLMNISRPDSPNFGKHLTAAEVATKFAPSQGSINAVTEWLSSADVGKHRLTITPSKQYVKFNASLDEVERLLQTKYHVYQDAETGSENFACEEYYVPQAVQEHIDFVMPTLHIAYKPHRTKLREPSKAAINQLHYSKNGSSQGGDCDNGLTPRCIQEKYGMPTEREAVPGNTFAIYEHGDAYNEEDLDKFWKQFANWVPQGTYPVLKSIEGGRAPEASGHGDVAGPESLLDFGLAIPLVYPQAVDLYQVGVLYGDSLGSMLEALDGSYCQDYDDCGTYKPANVISISYGGDEDEPPHSLLARQCTEFMKLALQGVTVIAASGDAGVDSRSHDPDHPECERFRVLYPASCPYVTAVGGTQVGPGGFDSDEVAVHSLSHRYPLSSGGGFSNYFARMDFQGEVIANFLETQPPQVSETLYNADGRAYPDVSAFADGIWSIAGGKASRVGGTSASVPIFASMITLINGERIKAGKSRIGFLNPIIYANPGAFNDVSCLDLIDQGEC
jgi:tripeptidyl-peptidase I